LVDMLREFRLYDIRHEHSGHAHLLTDLRLRWYTRNCPRPVLKQGHSVPVCVSSRPMNLTVVICPHWWLLLRIWKCWYVFKFHTLTSSLSPNSIYTVSDVYKARTHKPPLANRVELVLNARVFTGALCPSSDAANQYWGACSDPDQKVAKVPIAEAIACSINISNALFPFVLGF
jgi:hypothetical protein